MSTKQQMERLEYWVKFSDAWEEYGVLGEALRAFDANPTSEAAYQAALAAENAFEAACLAVLNAGY